MKVWRVAHKEATYNGFPSGPYACMETLPQEASDALEDMYGDHTDDSHKTPYGDGRLRGIRENERCGFNSREALDEWFAGWHETLDGHGFVVWVYEVDDDECRVGDNGQTVFNDAWADEIGTEGLLSISVQLMLW